MKLKPTETRWYILPTIVVVRYRNDLTEESKQTFNHHWDKYYVLEIRWLKWGMGITFK